MENNEYEKIMNEIEKIKFHNRSIITLLGMLNEEEITNPTIQETVVTFDLSKKDLREFTSLVKNYNGNNLIFEQEASNINPIFSKMNIIAILKSLVTSQMFKEESLEILNFYEE